MMMVVVMKRESGEGKKRLRLQSFFPLSLSLAAAPQHLLRGPERSERDVKPITLKEMKTRKRTWSPREGEQKQ